MNRKSELGTIWENFDDSKFILEQLFSLEIDMALQCAADADKHRHSIIIRGHPPATFFDPNQSVLLVMYTS